MARRSAPGLPGSAGRSILRRRCRWNRAPGPGMLGNERECEGMRGPARRPAATILSGVSGGRPEVTEGYYSNTGFSPQVGAMDATAGFSHLLSSNKLQASPLHPPHGGGREGAGRRRCRPARSSHRVTACSSPQGQTHRVGYTTQKTKARVEDTARERRTSRAGDGSRP